MILKKERLFKAQGVEESRERPEGANVAHRRIFKVG